MTEMKTKEEIKKAVVEWEYEMGESFLDYFDSDMNVFNFMFWCLGKGYIDQSQFLAYEASSVMSDDYLLGEEHYSVVKEEDDWEEPYHKSFDILAEFLSLSATYQKRLERFFEENPI